jgi:hypothetical protein
MPARTISPGKDREASKERGKSDYDQDQSAVSALRQLLMRAATGEMVGESQGS